MSNIDFETVIPTAINTLYPLIFTDIPFSKAIYDRLVAKGFKNDYVNYDLIFGIEARYKIISKLLADSGIHQILEIGCGYTPRGLAWCMKNKDDVYVELDLPSVIEVKQQVLEEVAGIPENLHLVSGNATKKTDIAKCLKMFDKTKQIAVINQGLLRYLDFGEKRLVAQNIYDIISKNNGVWITCDITPLNSPVLKDNEPVNILERGNNAKSRGDYEWQFQSELESKIFFRSLGFEIEWHKFEDYITFVSARRAFRLSYAETESYLKGGFVGVLKTFKKE